MSSLTRCHAPHHGPRALTPPALLKILMVFTAVLLFGLAHLHLRFSLDRVRTETNRLQSLQSTLRSEINGLRADNEALKHPERLFEYARNELGMVPFNPAQQETIRIPGEIYTRYAMARLATEETGGLDEEAASRRQVQWVQTLSDRVGLISQALAGESRK